VIKARFGSDADKVIHRVFPFVAKIRIGPDALTLLGVLGSFFAGAAFATGYIRTGGIVLVVAGFFDLIDGVVARSQGKSSSAGGFFDSTMDRLSDLLVFSGIAVGMARGGDIGGVLLVCWGLTAAVMTSYVRARAERHLARFDIGFMERAERVALIALAALVGVLRLGLWAVAIGATITAVQRVFAARRLLQELDRTGQDPTAVEASPDENP
jgi:CDP-diacylglycerol--glycerol-3-phosphate 3-phosphatidyltransferase